MTDQHTHQTSARPREAHSRHGWAMIACCIPMLLIVVALVATGVGPPGLVFTAIACTLMMALMMLSMDHASHDRRPPCRPEPHGVAMTPRSIRAGALAATGDRMPVGRRATSGRRRPYGCRPGTRDVQRGQVSRDPVARVYDRIARFYDLYDAPMDWLGGARRRRRVLSRATGRVLEVGIGTARNAEHYPDGVRVTGIDLSRAMLRRARERVGRSGTVDGLVQGDAQRLPYPDATFDTVAATCVFCSVADPVQGLREVRRVVKPTGHVLLMEHVRPRNRVLGWVFDLLSPLTRRLFGPSINRRTEDNVVAAGLHITDVRREGIWREITAVATE